MATLKMGSTTVLTDTTLDNAVQDNITRLGAVASGNINAVSDCVKIASGAVTATSGIDICGCFSSTYKFYKLWFAGWKMSAGGYIEIGYLDSSDNHIASDTYYTRAHEGYSVSGTGTLAWTQGNNNNSTQMNDTHGFRVYNTWNMTGTTNSERAHVEMTFYDPTLTTDKSIVHWVTSGRDTNYVFSTRGWGLHDSLTGAYGIKIHQSDGNNFVASGHWVVYGYKI